MFHSTTLSSDIIPLKESVEKQLCINFRDTVRAGNVEKNLKFGSSA